MRKSEAWSVFEQEIIKPIYDSLYNSLKGVDSRNPWLSVEFAAQIRIIDKMRSDIDTYIENEGER